MLLLALLQRSSYYCTVPSGSRWGGPRVGSLHPHHQQMKEIEVPSAVVSISSDRHVGLLQCGVGEEFLLRGTLRVFEYHDGVLF